MSANMISLEDVTCRFGTTTAVKNLSFQIEESETFGLIGTSGCGKTTTLRLINRMIAPSSGTIRIDGEETTMKAPEQLRRKMGYVIQNIGLFPHYSVRENVGIVPRLLDWNEDYVKKRTDQMLEMVKLDPATYAERTPSSLSGGQQQRVGLARALAADPPILLMDEPFGALDPITANQIRQEVQQLLDRMQKTVVLVTHNIREAFQLCDRLCLLDQGEVQQIGTGKKLLFQPANSFVDSFFASDRFQLELLSITLGDLLEEESHKIVLHDTTASAKEELAPSVSLYHVLEKMEKFDAGNPTVEFQDNESTQEKLDFTALMDRFQQVKLRLKSDEEVEGRD